MVASISSLKGKKASDSPSDSVYSASRPGIRPPGFCGSDRSCRAAGSVDASVVGLPEHVDVGFYEVCGDGLLVQRVGRHLVSSSGPGALEASELSVVVDGDDQLPDGQKDDAHQQDAADHGQEDHEDVWTTTALGFLQRRQHRQAAEVFRIRELHHTVVFRLIETQNSVWIVTFERFHGDDLVLTESLAGLIVGESS